MKISTLCLIIISTHISFDLYAGTGEGTAGWVDITIDTLKNIMVIAVAIITFIPGLFSYKEKQLAIKKELLTIRKEELMIQKLEQELKSHESK
jgi:hypothetical protein